MLERMEEWTHSLTGMRTRILKDKLISTSQLWPPAMAMVAMADMAMATSWRRNSHSE